MSKLQTSSDLAEQVLRVLQALGIQRDRDPALFDTEQDFGRLLMGEEKVVDLPMP